MKQKLKKQPSHEQLEAQVFTLEKLLENQPKVIDGKWNPKWFSIEGKIKKLKYQLSHPKTDLNDSWQKFLAQ